MKYFNVDKVLNYNHDDLFKWLKKSAGVQTLGFKGDFVGNLLLQQIPCEYVQLLELFKTLDIKSYCELGIGNGGSFLTNSIFIGKDCKKFHAIDSLQYGRVIGQSKEVIMEKVNILQNEFPESECRFFIGTTDLFFQKTTEKYDCIFIDADHTYEGVKKDFLNSLKHVNDNGILILHDIGNEDKNVGVKQVWNEYKHLASDTKEFMWKPDTYCGIGVFFV